MNQEINLYQPVFRKQRQIFSAVAMAQAVAIVAVALIGIHAYGLTKVRALEAEVAQLEDRENALTMQLMRIDPELTGDRRSELEAELKRLNATLVDQERLMDALEEQPLGATQGFSQALSALARQRTPQLWLTQLAINGGTGAIELAGRSLRPELVPEYMSSLGTEPALTGQRFDRFEIGRDDETGETTFRATSRAAGVALAAAGDRSSQ